MTHVSLPGRRLYWENVEVIPWAPFIPCSSWERHLGDSPGVHLAAPSSSLRGTGQGIAFRQGEAGTWQAEEQTTEEGLHGAEWTHEDKSNLIFQRLLPPQTSYPMQSDRHTGTGNRTGLTDGQQLLVGINAVIILGG